MSPASGLCRLPIRHDYGNEIIVADCCSSTAGDLGCIRTQRLTVDSKLHGCHLVRLRVRDLRQGQGVSSRALGMQQRAACVEHARRIDRAQISKDAIHVAQRILRVCRRSLMGCVCRGLYIECKIELPGTGASFIEGWSFACHPVCVGTALRPWPALACSVNVALAMELKRLS